MAKPPGRRKGVWIAVAVGLVLIVAVLLGVGELASQGGHTTTTTTTTASTQSTTATCTTSSGQIPFSRLVVVASAPCSDGSPGTVLVYSLGQPINIAVTVADSTTPVAIQTVLDGIKQNTNPWNVTETGHTYVLGYGGAGESGLVDVGTHTVYAVVTFADKTNATSDAVTFTVKGPAPQA